MKSICYYCGNEASTVEHVPPKCIFSKSRGFRRNLITVDSCLEHNLHKTNDDEYFKFLIVINIRSQMDNKHDVLKSVQRAAQYRPHVYKRFLKNQRDIIVKNTKNGSYQAACAIDIEGKRYKNIIDHISKGLFSKISLFK